MIGADMDKETTPQVRKILYATDLSVNSSYAFFYATEMARRFGAGIVIVHAVEPFPQVIELFAGEEAGKIEMKEEKETTEEIQGLLAEFCRKMTSQMGPPCGELVTQIIVAHGHPPDEILKTADEEDCDVIVLGSHGKGFLAHTFLGSVSSEVLHRTRKPVFIVPLPREKGGASLEEI